MGSQQGMNRRDFLRRAGITAAGVVVAGCGAPTKGPAASGTSAVTAGKSTAVATKAAAAGGTPVPVLEQGSVNIWSPGDNGTVKDWSKDPILQAVEKATNTKIKMSKVGWDRYVDQVNASVASGKTPDVICVIDPTNRALIEQWVESGVVAAYDEGNLAGKTQHVLAQYNANPTLNELKINGHIYMDPVQWGSGNYPNAGLVHVRKDLLDKYGMQAPDTFDQYFKFLAAAKKGGSTGVLFTAESGLGPNINPFVGAYGVPMLGWVKKGDKWEYWAVQPGTKNGLLLFRKMVAEGLVDPASWETNFDNVRDRYVAGQPASMIWNGGGHTGRIQNDMDLAKKGAKEWLLPAPDAGAGSRGYTTEPQFGGVTFITKMNGNNTEAAARVVDFLNSDEGYKLTVLGIKGRDYEEANGEIKLLPEQRVKDDFPTEAGSTGAHPMATAITTWVPQEWQDWQLLYGKDPAFKDWYKQMWTNQGKYQVKSYGLLSTSPTWTEFQGTSLDLINRAFLDIVRSKDESQAASRFDQFVNEWNSGGGEAASSEMSGVLSKIYT
jgi:putative aldouronate transport system substrate-binding protein